MPLTSVPILPSDAQGDIDGTLVVGRQIDKALLAKISRSVQVDVSIQSLNRNKMFGLSGGMPTRVAIPRTKLPQILNKLGLGPEDLSPKLVEKVVRHGGKDAFNEAREDLKEDVGIEISGKQVQRIQEPETNIAAQDDHDGQSGQSRP